jgi:transposase
MPRAALNALRELTAAEHEQLGAMVRATSERADVRQRAIALLAVAQGQSYTMAAARAGYASGEAVSRLVRRVHQRGLAALEIAAGRGRKPTYSASERQQILDTLQQVPERTSAQSATWSLTLLQRRLRASGLPQLSRDTIQKTLQQAGYSWQRTRTWCPTGTARRKRKAGVGHRDRPRGGAKQGLIEQAYVGAAAAGVAVWCQDEAGPYQTVPVDGQSWEPRGQACCQPHEYERNGTAKLLTLFHPATGQVRAKGVTSAGCTAAGHGVRGRASAAGPLGYLARPIPLRPIPLRPAADAAAASDPGLGQPGGPLERPLRHLALPARCAALVSSAEWQLAQHGRVAAAHRREASAVRPASADTRSDHHLVGGDRDGMECRPYAL